MTLIQAMQQRDLVEAGRDYEFEEARDDAREARRQDADEDYAPAKRARPDPPVNSRGAAPPSTADAAEEGGATAKAQAKPKGKRKGAPSRGVSLLDLIQEGYIEPGENVLSCPYLKEHHFSATLLSTGQLLYNGETFESPSSWSIHVKRSVNPSKKADDGWKSTYYVKDGTKTEKRTC